MTHPHSEQSPPGGDGVEGGADRHARDPPRLLAGSKWVADRVLRAFDRR